MNKFQLAIILNLLAVGFLTSCKKMPVAEPNKGISAEESAHMIAGALSSSTNGLNNLATDVTQCSYKLYQNNVACGATLTENITREHAAGAQTTFGFKAAVTSKVNCNTDNVYKSVTSTATFTGQYNGFKLISKGNGSAVVTVSGLGDTDQAFIINGMLKNMCNFKMKADTTRKGTISIKIGLQNLAVSKSASTVPATITGGTAAVSVTGNSPKGAFLFEGTVTFNGFNDATLIIRDEVFTINLATGAVTKR